jgi:hypothetical protein
MNHHAGPRDFDGPLIFLCLSAWIVACSGSSPKPDIGDAGPGPGPGGGTTGAGGFQAGGGSGGTTDDGSHPGSGGSVKLGGATGAGGDTATGGKAGLGGSSDAGGRSGSGGAAATGGHAASGGVPGKGGAAGFDGVTGSGGKTAVGGTTGAVGMGGTTGAGGRTAAGGTTAAGGRTGAGGSSGTSGGDFGFTYRGTTSTNLDWLCTLHAVGPSVYVYVRLDQTGTQSVGIANVPVYTARLAQVSVDGAVTTLAGAQYDYGGGHNNDSLQVEYQGKTYKYYHSSFGFGWRKCQAMDCVTVGTGGAINTDGCTSARTLPEVCVTIKADGGHDPLVDTYKKCAGDSNP